MKTLDFQTFLLRSAIFTMGVDGQIHDQELKALKDIITHTAYFLDFEYEEAMQESIEELKSKGKDTIQSYLDSISGLGLNNKQEFILLDTIFRIIDADNEVHPNEIQFLNMVKSRLNTKEEDLIIHFPKHIDYLVNFKGYGLLEQFDMELKLSN